MHFYIWHAERRYAKVALYEIVQRFLFQKPYVSSW